MKHVGLCTAFLNVVCFPGCAAACIVPCTLCRLRSVEIRVHWSVLIGAALVAAAGHLSGYSVMTMVVGVVAGLSAMWLHELGHAVAYRFAIPDSKVSVTFHSISTLLRLENEDAAAHVFVHNRGRKVWCHAAGPLTNLLLSAPLLLVGHFLDEPHAMLAGWINVAVAAFYLTPVSPFDGGEILMNVLVVAGLPLGRACYANCLISLCIVAGAAVANALVLDMSLLPTLTIYFVAFVAAGINLIRIAHIHSLHDLTPQARRHGLARATGIDVVNRSLIRSTTASRLGSFMSRRFMGSEDTIASPAVPTAAVASPSASAPPVVVHVAAASQKPTFTTLETLEEVDGAP